MQNGLPLLLDARIELVVTYETLVALLPAFPHNLQLAGRDGEQHRRRVVRAPVHDRHVTLPDPFQEPMHIFGAEPPLQPGFGLLEKRGVIRKLLVAVPLVQPIEARAEMFLLLLVKIEVAFGRQQRDVIELRVAYAHGAAAREQREPARQYRCAQRRHSRSRYSTIRRRIALSGKRPMPACRLSRRCRTRRVPGMTHVTAGWLNRYLRKN